MPSSDKTVYAAMAADLIVAAAKFVAAAFTGSASMLAEGVHSLVDTGNDGLLLMGSRLREREPDDEPSLRLRQGTLLLDRGRRHAHLRPGRRRLPRGGHPSLCWNPAPIESPIWNYAVLLIALLSDGYSWTVANRQLRETQAMRTSSGRPSPARTPRTSRSGSKIVPAVIGVVIAFLGVLLSHLTG